MSASAGPPGAEFEATFTSENTGEVNCGRCMATFPAGTQLHWIHNKDSTRAGRWLCSPCYNYYLSKGTTRRRGQKSGHQVLEQQAGPSTSSQSSHQGQLAPAAPSVIHKQVAAAQRGEAAYPVRAVGDMHQLPQARIQGVGAGPSPVQDLQSAASVNLPGQPSRTSFPDHLSQYPRAVQSGNSPFALPPLNLKLQSAQLFPALKSKALPANPGYQEAHQFYNEMRAYFASKAYSSNANAQVVTVKVWMMMRVPGRKTAVPVSDIFEAVSNIPVHIGLTDLKWVLYHSLLPLYIKWAKGFPLAQDECEVRNKLWVELIPKQPDTDAISDHFFSTRPKSNVKIFSPKQGIELYLSISHAKYEAIMSHLDEIDEKAGKSLQKSGSSSHLLNKRKFVEIEPDATSASLSPNILIKPTPEKVKHALQLQVAPRRKNMRPLFDNVMIPIKFFRPPTRLSFAELVERPQTLLHFEHFEPIQVVLSYCPSLKPQQGAFKIAHIGYTSEPLFGSSTQVCIKQTFFVSEETKKQVIYQGQTQASNLSVELNCLGWASALMDMVYGFMKKEEAVRGQPPFTVPKMHYVQAGLAISKDSDDKFSAFLLEEFIDSDSPGWFVKYINNSSAKPRYFKDEERRLRSEFLSFAQHVQFTETGGLAFVSDLQGGRSLLTDPQVITNPNLLGFIFGEGNTNFETFTSEHHCNRFCKFYQLPPLTEDNNNPSGKKTDIDPDEKDLFYDNSSDVSTLPLGILEPRQAEKHTTDSPASNSGTMSMEISRTEI